MLGEGLVKGWEGAELQVMRFLLQTFWVVEEQEEDRAWRCHPMNQYFGGSE